MGPHPLQNHLSQLPRAKVGIMGISIPAGLRNEDFAACLVKRYLAIDTAGRARYSGAYFERNSCPVTSKIPRPASVTCEEESVLSIFGR